MDSSPSAPSPDVSESRPSFRRPANDASRRNYRRHSPSTSRSPSPASSGGRKHDRSPSCHSQDNGELKRGRKAEPESEVGRGDVGRSRRGEDAGFYDFRSQNRDRYAKFDDYNHSYSRRHGGYYDRSHHGHSFNSSDRDSHTSSRSDYYRRDDGRHSRVDPRSPERTFRERGNDENRERRKESRPSERDRDRDKDRSDDRDRYRSKDRELVSGRAKSGAKRLETDFDEDVEGSRDPDVRERWKGNYRDRGDHPERDWHRDKDEARGGDSSKEKRESKVDKERLKDIFKEPCRATGRDEWKERYSVKSEDDYGSRDGYRGKNETEKDHKKCYITDVEKDKGSLNGGKESFTEQPREKSQAWQESTEKGEKKRKHTSEPQNLENKGFEILSELEDAATSNPNGSDAAASDHLDDARKLFLGIGDEKSAKGTKWGPEAEPSSKSSHVDSSKAEVENDLNQAKLAAMRAAELVNKNLGASGFMSADQKKRLLWGSKNQEPVAASGSIRWETAQFADRERQEKFNKLMGVKGESAALEMKKETDSKLFTAEKQQELQQDLEKQFTAGLRRRDGRTVGLGL